MDMDIQGKKALVTGGSGFIGRRLAAVLDPASPWRVGYAAGSGAGTAPAATMLGAADVAAAGPAVAAAGASAGGAGSDGLSTLASGRTRPAGSGNDRS